MEVDSALLFAALNGNFDDLSYVGSIVKACKFLARNIVNCKFDLVRRTSNHAAHVLAKAAYSMAIIGS